MAVDYEEARAIVERELKPGWNHGTFCVDDRQISETDEYFAFVVGAREFILEGNRDFEAIGGLTVVYKADGRVGSLPSVEVATNPTAKTRTNPNSDLPLDRG